MLGMVWHIWIGVVLVFAVLMAVGGLLGYYMYSVEAQKHPSGKRQRRHQDL
jgi:hypothetical protein